MAKPGELKLFVDYSLWIPTGVKRLRSVIVHQHGCGPGASIGGQTAADDLARDEAESKNLAAERPADVARLNAEYQAWLAAVKRKVKKTEAV